MAELKRFMLTLTPGQISVHHAGFPQAAAVYRRNIPAPPPLTQINRFRKDRKPRSICSVRACVCVCCGTLMLGYLTPFQTL